jgi:small-conductance mechanosensitive channel
MGWTGLGLLLESRDPVTNPGWWEKQDTKRWATWYFLFIEFILLILIILSVSFYFKMEKTRGTILSVGYCDNGVASPYMIVSFQEPVSVTRYSFESKNGVIQDTKTEIEIKNQTEKVSIGYFTYKFLDVGDSVKILYKKRHLSYVYYANYMDQDFTPKVYYYSFLYSLLLPIIVFILIFIILFFKRSFLPLAFYISILYPVISFLFRVGICDN